MEICRLCLQNIDEGNIGKPDETYRTLQKFFPYLNRSFMESPVFCEICVDIFNAAIKLMRMKKQSDVAIQNEIQKTKLAKINLRNLHENINMSQSCLYVCRICLKMLPTAKIFLCENTTNVLHHSFIKNMLKFCHLHLNCEISDRPVMCTECWELLQVSYNFKKSYLEVEKKIMDYYRDLQLSPNEVFDKEILHRVKTYFPEECREINCSDVKEEKVPANSPWPQNSLKLKKDKNRARIFKRRRKRKRLVHVKHENKRGVKKEELSVEMPHKRLQKLTAAELKIKINKQLQKLTTADLKILVQVYFEVTKDEKDFSRGYWQRLSNRWLELMPHKPLPGRKLSKKLYDIFRKHLFTDAEIEKLRSDVNAKIKPVLSPNYVQERYSDSDDSFVEEAVHSSFTPYIKSEPLGESDIELNTIELKLEIESDCDSLPELERMDLPLDAKFDNINSVDDKRELFNFMNCSDSNETVENPNKRFTLRDRNADKLLLFKCPECNFETKFQSCADRHAAQHRRGKQTIYSCNYCFYRISNKWMYNKHMKTHREELDIPVLYPEYGQ